MKYPVLTKEAMLRIASLPRKERKSELTAATEYRGHGDDFDDTLVKELRLALVKLMKKNGPSPKKGSQKTIRLEADASVIVHSALRGYEEAITMDLDFWTYVAFAFFEPFISWRYNLQDGSIEGGVIDNFGGGNKMENLMFRLWCRAELVFDPSSADQYYIARRGSIDFWRSHVLRQRYGNVRNFTRCFVLFQYPDPKKDERLTINQIRELAKRLYRLKSNVVLEILDDTEIGKLLERESTAISA